ncbi:RBBP9/YdeN family alpha/beta hydrolase [Polaromonas eurypsychrophila]|uniref:Alpha/beta hydrolase n=1 Tax=Polaromonas eurypsychrophila TaxID=1614635 RepID=A0A916SAR5_9BURK|nr:alpha/beta fold hydrolase [Polaromonas eurypsychrophila]GGA89131.1 alpha/beta hydrolase [Polaromonas eurypsychrophila]
MKASNVLVLPGWQNSGPGHWQSLWEAAHGYQRVEQHDWMQPLRGDWIARLEDVVLGSSEQVVLVAHSLGCILTAAWAAHSRNTGRVKAALLVAPPDVDREEVRQMLTSWAPVPMNKLPFPSVVLASSRDPYCRPERAREFAAVWNAEFLDAGPLGHLNADSGLADWPGAHDQLERLMALAGRSE